MSRVSVVMPVYNAERYVALSIQSILAQTFGDFEFIIIDDGSRDGSLKIVQGFASKDSRIRVVTRPNKGIVATLNEGVALAQGLFIARLDADDLSDPRRLELQVRRMDAEPQLVALGSGSIVIDPEGHKLGEFPVPLTHEEIDAGNLQGRSSIHHPAVMMRADALKQIGGYRDGLCPAEDLDLWLRLAEIGRVANLSEALLIRRLTLDGIVASTADRQTPTIRRILEDAWRRRGLSGEPAVPTIKPPTKADRYRQWGWTAVKYGQRKTSIRYALKSIETEPFSGGSWKLLLSSLRGR